MSLEMLEELWKSADHWLETAAQIKNRQKPLDYALLRIEIMNGFEGLDKRNSLKDSKTTTPKKKI